MELKWLEDFLTLCSTGNFRLAAELRCVSQPAFSRRIQALEAWVEAPLIDRSRQPSQLTEAGILFQQVAQDIVDLAETGKNNIQTRILEDKEKMRFSTLGTLAQIFIPKWLKTLQPFIDANQFSVKTEYSTLVDYLAALADNSVDLFVSYAVPEDRMLLDTTLFTSLKLAEETLVPVASPNADGTRRWWLPDNPTGPIPCLHTLSNLSPWPIKIYMKGKFSNLVFKSVYESSIGTTLKAMAVEGFGIAWLPHTLVVDELASGALIRAAEKVDDIRVEIRIYRCLKFNEPRVEKFWKVLLQQEMHMPSAGKTRPMTDNRYV